MIYECVINVSIAKEKALLDRVIDSAGDECIDVHQDLDHNRSVITLGSYSLSNVAESAYNVVEASIEKYEIANHKGVHPRLGIVDVVPFISYDETSVKPTAETILASHEIGSKVHENFNIPIFYYDYASELKTTLPYIRKNAFDKIKPDLGENSANEKFGTICIGAREPLIAINVNFDANDLTLAKKLAKNVRESTGGFKGVRAIGLELYSQNKSQVSMNIVDTKNVNLEEVLNHIIDSSDELDIKSEVELVGLMPQYVFETLSSDFRNDHGFSAKDTVEYRLSAELA